MHAHIDGVSYVLHVSYGAQYGAGVAKGNTPISSMSRNTGTGDSPFLHRIDSNAEAKVYN